MNESLRHLSMLGIVAGVTVLFPSLVVGMWALGTDKRRVVKVADVLIHVSAGLGILSGLLLLWATVL